MSSILKIEFENLRKTKSFWAIMLFLVFITSTVAITRSLEVGGSVGGINPAEPRAENGYFFEDNSASQIASSSWTPSGRKLGLPQPLRLRKQCQGMLQRVLLECSTPDSSSEGC